MTQLVHYRIANKLDRSDGALEGNDHIVAQYFRLTATAATRIVIVRHTAGLVTVYAHNHKNLVRSGQWVRQGTPIATVGRSGRATGYHLHFEVRRKTVPISPFSFLPPNRRLARLQRP